MPSPLEIAKPQLRAYGMVITKVDSEYRVNFKGGKEETAYYTTDLDDALATGTDMGRRREIDEHNKREPREAPTSLANLSKPALIALVKLVASRRTLQVSDPSPYEELQRAGYAYRIASVRNGFCINGDVPLLKALGLET